MPKKKIVLPDPPLAHIVPFRPTSYNPPFLCPVVRVTKKFIVVRYNSKATVSYRREDGDATHSGGYERFAWPSPKMKNFQEINAIAEANGGTIGFRDDKLEKSIKNLPVEERTLFRNDKND